MGRGEKPVLIEQHKLVGFRSKRGEAGLAEHPGAINVTVFGGHALDLALGVGKDRKGSADHRPAFVAWNMRKRLAPRRSQRDSGKAALCIDMAGTPIEPEEARSVPDRMPGCQAFCCLAASFKSGAFTGGIATRPVPVSGRAAAAFSFSMIFAMTAWPARSNTARFSIKYFCDSRSLAT